MRFFGVLILVWAYSSVHCGEEFQKFGCKFQNNKYDLQVDSPESPVWGTEAKVMQFAARKDFDKLVAVVQKANAEVLKDLNYNNMDELNEFYEDYIHHVNVSGKKDFDEFFQSYHPQYESCHASPRLVIELFERAVKAEPKLGDYYHLISCGAGIPRDMLYRLYRRQSVAATKTQGYAELWPYPYHNHVAGFIKVSIEGRKGYVLVDPGFALEHPIVIMEDGKDPHSVTSLGTGRNLGQSFSYQLEEAGSSYIVAHAQVPRSATPIPPQSPDTHFYYFGNPYCSFLDTTVKPNLARPRRAMEKRSADGKLEAQVELILFNSDAAAPSHTGPNDAASVQVTFTLYENGQPAKTGSTECFRMCSIEQETKNRAVFSQVSTTLAVPTLRDEITNLVGVVFYPGLREALYTQFQFLTGLPVDDLIKIRQQYAAYDKMDKQKRRGKLLGGLLSGCFSGW